MNKLFSNRGKKHPAYKNGIGKGRRQYEYQEQAYSIHGTKCQFCGSEAKDVHHKDNNPSNNPSDGSNWCVLCKSCHRKLHWDSIERRPAKEVYTERLQLQKLNRQKEKMFIMDKAKEVLQSDEVLTTKEVCKKLGFSREYIRVLREQGRINFFKFSYGNIFYPSTITRETIKKPNSKIPVELRIKHF